METIDRSENEVISYARKPRKCPICGGKVANIFYGMPRFTDELQKALEEKRIVLGGCCVPHDIEIPWQCTECGQQFSKKSYLDEMTHNISSENITELKENEVFVFGSNIEGAHGGGAALFAYTHFGAEWGVGEGLTGQCYALPTMEGYKSLKKAVRNFIACAKANPDKKFLVTPVGCGIAGYSVDQVAPLFKDAACMANVYLPEMFIFNIQVTYCNPNEVV